MDYCLLIGMCLVFTADFISHVLDVLVIAVTCLGCL